jgi:hypothetical protein
LGRRVASKASCGDCGDENKLHIRHSVQVHLLPVLGMFKTEGAARIVSMFLIS